MYKTLLRCEPLNTLGSAFSVALIVLTPLPATKPPVASPKMARYSNGTHKAARLPWTA